MILGQGVLILLLVVLLIIKNMKSNGSQEFQQVISSIEKIKEDMSMEAKATRQEIFQNTLSQMRELSELITNNQLRAGNLQQERISELLIQVESNHQKLEESLNRMVTGMDNRISHFSVGNEQKLENIRHTVKESLKEMQQENGKKLEEMRHTVDEKLQKTFEDRIGQSFKMVSERLEQVYKGLGEMQNLASGVGDLKKVLSNVKSRGIVGEIQLGAILEQMLSPEQYETNVATVKGSKNVVEFAIKLPGDEEGCVYLPIDSKFPGDTYSKVMDAYDSGNSADIEHALVNLERVIKYSAKEIRDKYIEIPYTTDFAIMFLPFEGLYAEVVRRGMIETLQREYKINIAGPTTMAALLNSLQMGFKTLAIQKRSSEVWNVLGAVKTEFEKFGTVLVKTQQRLDQANKELDTLVGVRTRQIQRSLSGVTRLPEEKAALLLGRDEEETV